MGIFINLTLSGALTQEEWEPVYEESLHMAKRLRFFVPGQKEIHGEKIACVYPTCESEYFDEVGWGVSGNLPSYGGAEFQFTPKYISSASKTAEPDALISEAPLSVDLRYSCTRIWDNKTQGNDYHMGLLAIGCMAEHKLGIKAIVGGDITYGQCRTSAKMASAILGTEVKLPIRCRLNDFGERVKNIKVLTETEQLTLLLDKFIGEKNEKINEYVKENFSEKAIAEYWTNYINDVNINTIGFDWNIREYFTMGFGLNEFCHYANFDKTDAEQCKCFIRKILKTSMHIKDKDCEDYIDYSKASRAYGLCNQHMVDFFMDDVKNPSIDRYIPLSEMKAIFRSHFGSALSTDDFVDEYINETKSDEKPEYIKFKESVDEYYEKNAENHKKYDICDYDELCDYKPGDTFSPEMKENIERSFHTYIHKSEEPECIDEMSKSVKEMFHFLVEGAEECYLIDSQWNKIYDELVRDRNTFKRYYPMTMLRAKGDLNYLLRGLITDDNFWEFCCENFQS